MRPIDINDKKGESFFVQAHVSHYFTCIILILPENVGH
jgi:hypothetical protein